MPSPNLHSGHRKRMKQRFLNYPAEFMYDHELLEIALFYCRSRSNTNETAHILLDSFGSVSSVLDADISALTQVNGIGSSSAQFVSVLSEGVRRYLSRSHSPTLLMSADDIKAFLLSYFSDSDSHSCCILTVSPSMELLSTVSLPFSDMVSGRISQREIAEILIMHSSYRIILAVFHPTKSCIPAPDDFSAVSLMSEICRPLDIDFTDAFICSRSDVYSMKKHSAFSFLR